VTGAGRAARDDPNAFGYDVAGRGEGWTAVTL
jgi:hypothetical protein